MDDQIVAAAQGGDQRAFGQLAATCGHRLHALAWRILRDQGLAEDATQEALLAIWRDLPQLRDPARFDAWTYRVVVRACYAARRRTARASAVRPLWDAEARGRELDVVIDRDQLERAFAKLSVDHRAIVVLHHYLDLSLDEVADALQIAPGTVRSRLYHAMRALRAALDADARSMTAEAFR